jgi:hypothetical protein
MSEQNRSTPSYFDFNPNFIPYQIEVLDSLDAYDYSQGLHEVLLSGSVGSAKSILCAHAAVRHCIENDQARFIIGRRTLPDIKKTMFQMIVEHLECDELEEGRDYFLRENTAEVFFRNGSEIVPYYWADKKFKRVRSVNASSGWIEELTENDEKDSKAFFEMKARLGRLKIKEKFLLCSTNPDSPAHWAHKYFIEGSKTSNTRHVFYSKTRDNPFLDPSYIRQLEEDLDPKEARRLIHGEWVEINSDRIYSQYDSEKNYINKPYTIKRGHPIALCFDFNIGHGKPMSSCALQSDDKEFHIFNEVVIEGARTEEIMDEWFEKGIFNHGSKILIYGDASGRARDTRNIRSDYDIIENYLKRIQGLKYEMRVPRDNPAVRTRHNLVNAYCLNEAGERRLFVYKDAKVTHDGMRLTSLKPGGNYIEDDSKPYQHVTTALGYCVVYEHHNRKLQPISNQRR